MICLFTGEVATDHVEFDLLQAKYVAERAYRTFSKKRLEPYPPKIKFHDTVSKLKLKTFSHLNKKVQLQKGNANEIVFKNDHALFVQMIAIAEAGQRSLKHVLSHPLCPLPRSLTASGGSLRKKARSSIAKELRKNAPAVENLPLQSAYIMDGIATVQRLKGEHKTLQIWCWQWSSVKA